MVYNEKMDQKLNAIIANWKNYSIKKMFGGTGYLLDGKMVAGVYKDYYILRLGEKNAAAAFTLPKVKVFDITGRPMKGWIMAEEDAFSSDNNLVEWLKKAKQFVETL
ncbi:MAG: TfoX/Sxy family protein [Candidatus Thorarchaeota archaeon]